MKLRHPCVHNVHSQYYGVPSGYVISLRLIYLPIYPGQFCTDETDHKCVTHPRVQIAYKHHNIEPIKLSSENLLRETLCISFETVCLHHDDEPADG